MRLLPAEDKPAGPVINGQKETKKGQSQPAWQQRRLGNGIHAEKKYRHQKYEEIRIDQGSILKVMLSWRPLLLNALLQVACTSDSL